MSGDSAISPTATAPLLKGDDVYVFYQMEKRCQASRKYFAALDPRQGSYRPRVGMSEGWVPARVMRDHDPTARDADVLVEYRWPYFHTQRGHLADSNSGWMEGFPAHYVRRAPGSTNGLPVVRPLIPPGSRPELAIITFRWGGTNEIVAPEQWGETGSSVSDLFVESFIDSAVIPRFGPNYEVWTAYVQDHSDILKIAESAHLMFGPNHPIRRARHTVGMYFLYPTAFEEGCIPNHETGEDHGAALVDHNAFFRMIKAVERCGIPTRFPHPSGFYEVLTSKRWNYMMSMVPHLRVPPTVGCPRMLIERSCKGAAAHALASLNVVKRQQAKLSNSPLPTTDINRGVAKLGFSWEALDVKYWEGESGLESALHQLTQAIEISGELTGQPHDLESIIVQEYCEHDLELRLYAVEGQVEVGIYTKFLRIKQNQEFGDFKELFTGDKAADAWMGGDRAALEDGERQCREITDHWLHWVRAQICEVPPAVRFDFFVGRTAEPGKAVVWTLEICELGFSMLGEQKLPSKVFAAMLRSCLGESSPSREKEQEVCSKIEPANVEDAASVASAGGANAEVPDGVPPVLHILVPSGPGTTSDQQMCSGMYEMVRRTKVNRRPLWQHVRGDRWLYFGCDDYWYVGDEEEKGLNFKCMQGYIRHPAGTATTPEAFPRTWEKYLTSEDWVQDDRIVVGTEVSAVAKGKGGTKSR